VLLTTFPERIALVADIQIFDVHVRQVPALDHCRTRRLNFDGSTDSAANHL